MGWCKAYPKTSEFHYCLPYQYPGTHYYHNLYCGMSKLLTQQWMQRIIKLTYSCAIVDEYQDCTSSQNHLLFDTLRNIIPLTILGDPLQGIFYFSMKSEQPCNLYKIAQQCDSYRKLNTPWRWKFTCPSLGKWLSKTRNILEEADKDMKGTCIIAPDECEYISYIPPTSIFENLRLTDSIQESTAFIARNEKTQIYFSRRTSGKFSFHEKKDDTDIIEQMKQIDNPMSPLSIFIDIYKNAFTHTDKLDTLKDKLSRSELTGWNRNKYPDLLSLFQELHEIPFVEESRIERYNKIKLILRWPMNKAEFSCIRPNYYHHLLAIVDNAIENRVSLENSYQSLYSHLDGPIYKCISTRTVLAKGLEFDNVIIDISGAIDDLLPNKDQSYYVRRRQGQQNWDVRNFYVAISRAKKKIFFIGTPGQTINLREYRRP